VAASGDNEIGSGLQSARQEYAVGRVFRNGIADFGAIGYKAGVFFEEI
jgi:hypothetical protein